jgi:hypothetical protein
MSSVAPAVCRLLHQSLNIVNTGPWGSLAVHLDAPTTQARSVPLATYAWILYAHVIDHLHHMTSLPLHFQRVYTGGTPESDSR